MITTNMGVALDNNQASLKAGLRGPTLMEDFILREKITHFDHERIPERIVHARGSGAHGYFECYKPLTKLTRAAPFTKAGKRTPVFVRFSTVVGERGSTPRCRHPFRGLGRGRQDQRGGCGLPSSRSKVKDFARMMVTDHTSANTKLKALASSKKVTLPAGLDKDHQQKLTKLKAAKPGKEFDETYADLMEDGHDDAVKLFEKASKDAKDEDVQLFATEALPTLKQNSEHAEKLDSMDIKS